MKPSKDLTYLIFIQYARYKEGTIKKTKSIYFVQKYRGFFSHVRPLLDRFNWNNEKLYMNKTYNP